MTDILFRLQNNRDKFFCHVSNDDFDVVKDKPFKMSYVGANVILRRDAQGVKFRDRWGTCETRHADFTYAIPSLREHPFFPLFGPFECEGSFDAHGNIYIMLPNVLELPWPSSMCSKYEFDDASCEKLLNDRVNALRGMQINCMPIPDYMAVFIGYERLKDLMLKNPWLDIVRCGS